MATITVIQPSIMTETVKRRVAAYCRVSSSSEDQLNSYQAQLTYYSHKFEDSVTEELVDLYADESITGTRDDKRDEFQRLMKDCRRGKIDRIYTKSISRFARNTKDCLKNLRELKALGITVFFEKENIDTANMTDEIMITILGGLAQEESVSISQNMRWSAEKRMQNGTFIASTPPYGYKNQDGKLVINAEEAIIVRQIYTEYLSGNGLKEICRILNDSGVSAGKYGKCWHVESIRYILTNEKYIGDCLWQKRYTESMVPFRRRINEGQVNSYYIPDDHEFIRLHNKLLCHYRSILFPIQQMLQELKCKKYGGNVRVMDIHKEIAKLREQNHVIARLRTKGFMDEGKFQEQSKELNNKIRKLQAELKKITRSDDEDDILEQLDMLIDYFEKREQIMVSFEPETFDSVVDKITANQNELTFHLLGGIELKEKI